MSDFDEGFLNAQAELTKRGYRHGLEPFRGEWSQRDPMGIPGPLYVSNDDVCGAGVDAAPNNVVLVDKPEDGEFIFRQPSNLYELGQVLEAADVNPVRAYGLDGNRHWTPESVIAWWHTMQPIRQTMREHKVRVHEAGKALIAGTLKYGQGPPPLDLGRRRWLRYLDGGAELYLRRYAFFLHSGRVPREGDSLPSL